MVLSIIKIVIAMTYVLNKICITLLISLAKFIRCSHIVYLLQQCQNFEFLVLERGLLQGVLIRTKEIE